MSLNIPVIAGTGGAGGGDNPPPALVTTLTRGANAALDDAERLKQQYIAHTAALAAADHQDADDAAGLYWSDTQNAIVDHIAKADKARQVIVDDITRQANARMNEATQAVKDVGGSPYILTGEAIAANETGSHWADAMNRMILPAIEQQRAEIAATPPVGSDRGDLPTTTSTEPVGKYKPPAGPGGGGPPVILPKPGPNPCHDGDPTCSAPPAPPTPTVPPPGVPPTATGSAPGVCCPAPTIVVNVPPCPPGSSVPPPPTTPPPSVPPSGVGSPPPPCDPTDPAGACYVPPAAQPTPPPAVPPPPLTEPLSVSTFDGAMVCELLRGAVEVVGAFGGGGERHPVIKFLADLVGLVVSSVPGLHDAGVSLRDTLYVGGSVLLDQAGAVVASAGLSNPTVAAGGLGIQTVAGFLNKWIGAPTDYFIEPLTQTVRYADPVYLPDQSTTDSALLSNVISQDTWECWTRTHGNMPWSHFKAVEAARTRPGVQEVISLFRRGLLTQAQADERFRGLGVIDPNEGAMLYALSEVIPTVGDIFKYLVKDVANQEFVQTANLDEGFADSWNDQFQAWADANGISQEQIKYEYRAQWADVPLTQIFQMWWRLRPGRVPDDLVFTEEQAKFMMKIQEVQPGFRDRLMRIAYLPINRTDIMSAYTAGTMSKDEVYERFQDLGYIAEDAQAMTDMLVTKAAGQLQSSLGAWTRRRINREYIDGTITHAQADRLLSRTVLDAQVRGDALDDADTIRSAKKRAACIKGVKRRYYTGEFNSNTARLRLMALGLEQAVIIELLDGWECERSSKSKEPTIAMLTSWVTKGIITWDQFGRRLSNLGYTDDDVLRIRQATDLDARDKAARENQATLDKAAAKNEKAANKARTLANEARTTRKRIHDELDHNKEKHKGPDPGPGPVE